MPWGRRAPTWWRCSWPTHPTHSSTCRSSTSGLPAQTATRPTAPARTRGRPALCRRCFLPRPPLISCWLILQALWRRGRQQSAQRVRVCRRFRLINQRQDVVALFLRNVTRATQFSASRVLARSAPVRLQDPNNPQHLHLAIAAAERCAAHTQPVSCSICCMHALKLPGATQQALRIAARPAVSTALAAWHTAYTP
jgi:hypothetical protein